MKDKKIKFIKVKREISSVIAPLITIIGIITIMIVLSLYSYSIGDKNTLDSQGILLWIATCSLINVLLIKGLKMHCSNFVSSKGIVIKGFIFKQLYKWENLTEISILDDSSIYYQKVKLVFGKRKLIFLTAEIKNKNEVLCEILENSYDRTNLSFKVLKHFCMYIKPETGTKAEKAYHQFLKTQNSLKTMPLKKMEEIDLLLNSFKNEKIKPALDFEIKDYMENKIK